MTVNSTCYTVNKATDIMFANNTIVIASGTIDLLMIIVIEKT